MKYIVYEMADEEFAIVFQEHLVHKQIAKGLRTMDGINRCKPISAGFCSLTVGGRVSVRGRSESLNLESRDTDPGIIERSVL